MTGSTGCIGHMDRRIVFVALAGPSGMGGQDVATKEIAAALGRHPNVGLMLLCPKPAGELPPELARYVSRALYLPPKKRRSLRWQFKAQFALFRHLRIAIHDERPCLVVARWAPSLFVAPILSRIHGIPYVLLVRGIEGVTPLEETARWRMLSNISRLSLKLNVRLAKAVFVAYEEVKDLVCRLAGGRCASVEVFPNAVDPRLFPLLDKNEARSRVAPHWGPSDFVVGFVGSMHKRHCLKELVLAVAQLVERGRRVKLLLVGAGDEVDSLKELTAHVLPAGAVLFIGFVPHNQVVSYMAACDVLYGVVHPDRPSNPIKCYEYLAAGRPIITSKTNELAFVEERGFGFSLATVSPSSIAEAIQALMSKGERERLEMGRRGRDYVLTHHTWDVLASRIVNGVQSPTD